MTLKITIRPITILEQIISEHDAFSIRQPFIRLKEMEQNFVGKPKNLSLSTTASQLLKLYFTRFLDSRFFNSWTKRSEKYIKAAKTMVLAEGLFTFVHIISYIWVDGKSTKFTISPFNEFLGCICYIDLEEARPFVKDIYIVLTTERCSDLVEYHVHLQAI